MKTSTNQKGQTLVETMVAVGIIAAVLIAALSLVIAVIQAGIVSRERVQAANLAQEGLEAVRNIRDSYWINSTSGSTINERWKAFKDSLGIDEDITPPIPSVVRNVRLEGTNWVLKENSADFNETLGTTTFTRRITITDLVISNPLGEDKLKVTARVSWENNTKSVTLSTYITNWAR